MKFVFDGYFSLTKSNDSFYERKTKPVSFKRTRLIASVKFFKYMRQSMFVDSASVVFYHEQYTVFYRSQIYADGRILAL